MIITLLDEQISNVTSSDNKLIEFMLLAASVVDCTLRCTQIMTLSQNDKPFIYLR